MFRCRTDRSKFNFFASARKEGVVRVATFVRISAESGLALTPGRVLVRVSNAICPEPASQDRAGVRRASHFQARVVNPTMKIAVAVLPHLQQNKKNKFYFSFLVQFFLWGFVHHSPSQLENIEPDRHKDRPQQ
jgi:hypothetical protein